MGGRPRRSASSLDPSLIIDQPRARKSTEHYQPQGKSLRIKFNNAAPHGRPTRASRSVNYDEDAYGEETTRRSSAPRITRPKRESSTAVHVQYDDGEEEEPYDEEDGMLDAPHEEPNDDLDQEMDDQEPDQNGLEVVPSQEELQLAENGLQAAGLPSEDLGGYEPPSEITDVVAVARNGRHPPPESNASGSNFDLSEDANLYSEDGQPAVRDTPRSRGKRTIVQDSDEEDTLAIPQQDYISRSGRSTKRKILIAESDDDFGAPPRASTSRKIPRRRSSNNDFVASDEEEEMSDSEADYGARRPAPSRHQGLIQRKAKRKQEEEDQRRRLAAQAKKPSRRNTRNSRAALDTENDDYIPEPEDEEDRQYTFRARKKHVNYVLPTIEQINAEAAKNLNTRRERSDFIKPKKSKNLPFSMSGRQLDALFGNKPETSDDEARTPRKRGLFGAPGMFGGTGGMLSGGGMDMNGTPGNFGRVGNQNLADTDPLSSAVPVTFGEVGGMEQHIQQLKEMVSLPLLYPEVFQRFSITPPRGVLFHGPPGTGKTLLARALAASCSTSGQKISFFMRKGADCLSKWVGEAERQLRLLFEEAKQSQPSIIFFDEIDGLAPVRSSKQEQIHASIVSTLLALMDGMDGRGQVVVIGATNRPDAVDPALRRPGRFDREFYFPLPNRDARRQIIDIHTKGWEPGLESDFKDELAVITKGYGGADIRALCTEAALNAVQRKYPQIYKTNDRLLIKPETINVTARDFIISAKNLIPSTARSTSTLAAPLPDHLKPLLQDSLEAAKSTLGKILPDVKKISVLEEAEFEEDSDAGFAKEKLMQTYETMRVYRPRLVVCGQAGMGQSFLGPAILHHLEGFHVQSLDLGALVGDSTRSIEAACVQLFTEAKRHKPSILYIPSLTSWCSAVNETARATIKGMLDSMDPSDPILLLAVVDGSYKDVPTDLKSWFGFMKSNRITLEAPKTAQRGAFFTEAIASIRRPPSEYPDAMVRRKRVLEELPKAPPRPPRQLTEAELLAQEQHDGRLREYIKFKLGPIIAELKKRYRRFAKPIGDDYEEPPESPPKAQPPALTEPIDLDAIPDSEAPQPEVEDPLSQQPADSSITALPPPDIEKPAEPEAEAEAPAAAPVTSRPTARYVDVDLDKINLSLYYDEYLTPDEFIKDVRHIVNNASLDPDPEMFARAGMMLNHAQIMLDQVCDYQFQLECARMAAREKNRQQVAKEKALAAEKVKATAEALPKDTVPQDALDKSLKRPRSGTDQEGSGDEQPEKRSKVDQPDSVSGAMQEDDPFAIPQPSTTIAQAPVDSTVPAAQQMDLDEAIRKESPLETNINQTHEEPAMEANSPTPTATNAQPNPNANNDAVSMQDKATTPEPLPPLIIPEEDLSALEYALGHSTDGLAVDHLEQLRAAIYDATWRARKDWDKTDLVEELREMLPEFVEECKAHQRELQREEEL